MIFKEELSRKIREILLANQNETGDIYLVGGFIRDSLAGRVSHDYDFVLQKKSIESARKIADQLDGDFYILDKERQTARVIIHTGMKKKTLIDFSLINGGMIINDLKSRDFTINSIATHLQNMDLFIDPLGGVNDLEKKWLNPCNKNSFISDPVRVLRAVRFIQSFDLKFTSEIEKQIIQAVPFLIDISPERIRDELCQLFLLKKFIGSLGLMNRFQIIQVIFPEMLELKNVPAIPPHVYNGFDHTVKLAEYLQSLVQAISSGNGHALNPFHHHDLSFLENYQDSLNKYFFQDITPDRPVAVLIIFSALYHDIAKARINPVERKGKFLYPNHAEIGAEVTDKMLRNLALSNKERDFIVRLIRFHMIKDIPLDRDKEDINRSIYHFFKDTQETGIAACFLHLADIFAAYEDQLTKSRLQTALRTMNYFLNAWFNHYHVLIDPPMLINGEQLMARFDLQPGEIIGEYLETIKEETAAGTITNSQEALNLIDHLKREGYFGAPLF